MDMENMFDLLAVPQEVKDADGASALSVKDGSIQFDNVTFEYNMLVYVIIITRNELHALISRTFSLVLS